MIQIWQVCSECGPSNLVVLALFHFGLIYVLGRSLIWICRILNFENLFLFFQLRLPLEQQKMSRIQKFKIQQVQINELQHWY